MQSPSPSRPPTLVQSVLPSYLHPLIPHPIFTPVQSHTLDTWHAPHNILISAPTGAGKTVCFELALLRLIHHVLNPRPRHRPGPHGLHGKVLYLAPTKALCTDRVADWSPRFAPLAVRVELVTGDISSSVAHHRVALADVVVTTPEKWDSLTRDLQQDHSSLRVCLLLLDEVHHVGDDRGVTLETVVTRLLTASDAARAVADAGGYVSPISALRIIAVSATIRNASDVAAWLRVPPQGLFVFGDEYRPVPLEHIVRGYYASNEWQYSKVFDKHLLDMLLTYADGKPSIVFCTSRAQTIASAKALVARLQVNGRGNVTSGNKITRFLSMDQRQALEYQAKSCEDVVLQSTLPCGIGVHNADMSAASRALVERLFKARDLLCLFSTSTLAQGVNLPARLVVICGTAVYHDGALREYDSNLLLQMCGRAGRTGLDSKGVAVIMTAQKTVELYKNLKLHILDVESQLMGRLEAWLNGEIARELVHDVQSVTSMLTNTFYWRRLTKADGSDDNGEIEGTKAMGIAMETLRELSRTNLIKFDEFMFGVASTELGTCVARHNLSYKSVKELADQLGRVENPSGLLKLICNVDEVKEGVFVRRGEKKRLNELNELTRMPVRGRVKEAGDKVSVLLQTALAGWFDKSGYTEDYALRAEAERLLGTLNRVCGSALELMLGGAVEMSYGGVLAGLQVSRAVHCRCLWDEVSVLRSVCGIDRIVARRLRHNKITAVADVQLMDSAKLVEVGKLSEAEAEQVMRRVGRHARFCIDYCMVREDGGFGRVTGMDVWVRVEGSLSGGQEGHGFVLVGSHLRGVLCVRRFPLEQEGCHVFCEIGQGLSEELWRGEMAVIAGNESVMGLDAHEHIFEHASGSKPQGKMLMGHGRLSKRPLLDETDASESSSSSEQEATLAAKGIERESKSQRV